MKETHISLGVDLYLKFYSTTLTSYLLEGLSELPSRGHTQLLCDMS